MQRYSRLHWWLLAFAACAPVAQVPSTPAFSVQGGFIRDADGRVVVLRGANVSGKHKWAPYFDDQGPADYEQLRSWGFNGVRYLVSWAAIEPTEGQYDDAYLAEVKRRVTEVTQAGLLVFLDMHEDLYGIGFPGGDGAPVWTCDVANYQAYVPTSPWFLGYTTDPMKRCFDHFWGSRALQAKFVAAWARLAKETKGIDGVIGFDPLNEPYWGSLNLDVFEPARLQPLYSQVIAAVRAEQPDALAFIEPGANRNLGFPTYLAPFDAPNIVYAPHSYDADAEGGKGFDAAHHDALVKNVHALADEAKALNAALVIGEYGGVAANPGITDYMHAQYEALGQVLGGGLYWHFGKDEGYGLLHLDGTEKTELLDAVAVPAPARVAGIPGPWAFDASTKTFAFSWRLDASVKAKTEIAVPDRTWPAGFQVECGGCTWHREAHTLVIDTLPAGATTASVRVSPTAP